MSDEVILAQPPSMEALQSWDQSLSTLDPNSAKVLLGCLGRVSNFIEQAETAWCMKVGELLHVLKDRTGENGYVYEGMGYRTWPELWDKLPSILGKSERVLYESMQMVSSKILSGMSEAEVNKIPKTNALAIASVEASGSAEQKRLLASNGEIILKAQQMRVNEFRTLVGMSRGGVIQQWCPDADTARELRSLVSKLKTASASAVSALNEFLDDDEVMALSSGGIDYRIDLLVAGGRAEVDDQKRKT